MYVYRKFDPDCYTVGHYEPGGEFIPESDWPTSEQAAARVAFLNGGHA